MANNMARFVRIRPPNRVQRIFYSTTLIIVGTFNYYNNAHYLPSSPFPPFHHTIRRAFAKHTTASRLFSISHKITLACFLFQPKHTIAVHSENILSQLLSFKNQFVSFPIKMFQSPNNISLYQSTFKNCQQYVDVLEPLELIFAGTDINRRRFMQSLSTNTT